MFKKLLEHVDASPLDYFDVADGNLHLKDMNDLPEHLKTNLKQIEVVTTKVEAKCGPPIEKQVVRIQVVDQQKALEMICRSLAMFQDTKITNETNIAVQIRDGVSRIKRLGRLDGHRSAEQPSSA